jgi:hypothetical protein
MTEEQFKAIQGTFPWTHVIEPSGLGGVIRVLNRHGEEVSLFDMVAFLEVITQKLKPKETPHDSAQG